MRRVGHCGRILHGVGIHGKTVPPRPTALAAECDHPSQANEAPATAFARTASRNFNALSIIFPYHSAPGRCARTMES
jgi:hypothetical protein